MRASLSFFCLEQIEGSYFLSNFQISDIIYMKMKGDHKSGE